MITTIINETARNHTKLFEAGLSAMQKVTEQQITFAQNATEQIVRINLDLAGQTAAHCLNAMTQMNQLWRETVIRAAAIPATH